MSRRHLNARTASCRLNPITSILGNVAKLGMVWDGGMVCVCGVCGIPMLRAFGEGGESQPSKREKEK